MQPRTFRIQIRNPVVGAALAAVAVALVLVLLVFGLAILAGLAVVGGVVLLARRLMGRPVRPAGAVRRPDPSLEVFSTPAARSQARLPHDPDVP